MSTDNKQAFLAETTGGSILTIEVGGSSIQAVRFDESESASVVALDSYRQAPWLLAAPGLVDGDRVQGAHHLAWIDVQASQQLELESAPLMGMNDADAAALGEWVLRDRPAGTLFYISMGTGIGATSVQNGIIVPIEFGHLTAFGPKRCGGCGRVGCLDAQIGGHALPTPLDRTAISMITSVLGAALSKQEFVMDRIVIGGGLARRYPGIVSGLIKRIGRTVELSAAPQEFKSAAPIGLLHAWRTR